MPGKKPRLRKVLLLCAIWGKVCTLLTFSASWDEWYLSQTTLLNRTLKRTKMPTLSWYRTLSAPFLIRTYFVPHSQAGSTKLMENVSAIVIKRLLITWAIITIITCVRVKTKVAPKQQPLVLSIFLLTANDKTILMMMTMLVMMMILVLMLMVLVVVSDVRSRPGKGLITPLPPIKI